MPEAYTKVPLYYMRVTKINKHRGPPGCVAPQEEVMLGCVYCLYASPPFYSFLLSFSAQEIPQQQEVEFRRAGEGRRWFRFFLLNLSAHGLLASK